MLYKRNRPWSNDPPDNRHSRPHRPSNGISLAVWYKPRHWHSSLPSSYRTHPAPPWSNFHMRPPTMIPKLPNMTEVAEPTDRGHWEGSDRGEPTSWTPPFPWSRVLLFLQFNDNRIYPMMRHKELCLHEIPSTLLIVWHTSRC